MVYSNLLLCGGQLQVCFLLIKRRSHIYIYCTGVFTFDLGQNMAGVCRSRFHGPPGFGTYFRHGEVLVQPVISNK